MKKLLSIVFVCVQFIAFAQHPQARPGAEKLRAVKVGMITQELDLSSSQAEKFWPVYNNYSEEKSAIHRQIRTLTHKNEGLSNDELIKRQDEILDLKQKEITVVKKYRDDFLKVITPSQYAKMMETERKFTEMLLQKLKERKEKN